MAPRILLADSDEAFGAMLKEMLEAEAGYSVVVARSAREALDRLRGSVYALTIVDMGLAPGGDTYLDLIRQVRQDWPSMRLVIIPLMGEDVPPEARRLDIQGTLTKPVFADDLLPSLQEALAKQVSAPTPPPVPVVATPVAPVPVVPSETASVAPPAPVVRSETASVAPQAVLATLARETGAEPVLLISTASGREGLVSSVGLPSGRARPTAEALITSIVAAIRAAQAVGPLLGQPDIPFEHNMFESGSLRLYVMTLPGEQLLAVVTPIGAPLGMIRQNLRRACRDLAGQSLT
jgi:CheY-like chemotaxis protein